MEGTNVLFSIGPVQITSTLVTMWVIILILTILSILATRKLKDVPGPLQNIAEMAVESLQKAGLRDFQISVGHVQFFASLAKEAGLDEATEEELKQLIRNKNNFGVEQLLSEANISEQLKEIFISLPALFGGEEVLKKALSLTEGMEAAKALQRLQEVLEILKIY